MQPEKTIWINSQHEFGVERFYGRGVENYGDFHGGYLNFGLWDQDITEYILAAENLVSHMGTLLNLNKNSLLLDIACGMGPQDLFLYNKFKCKIHALDATYKHVLTAQERINKAQLSDNIKVLHGTATQLPFQDNTFTHLMSIEGPEHFNTREAFLKEAFRVLKPNGILALSDYNLKKVPTKLWEKILVELARLLWHVPKENCDTIENYRKKLEKTGFTSISFDEVGFKVIPGYYLEQSKPEIKKELSKIRGWFSTYPGHLINWTLYKAYKNGLIDYIFVRAEKPN